MQEGGEPRSTPEFAERLPKAVEAFADRIVHHQRRIADQDQTPIDHLLEKTGSGAGKNAYSLEELLSAVSRTSGAGFGTRTLQKSVTQTPGKTFWIKFELHCEDLN